jgi:pimeloyl-ACP methyl ester carboxylesterase
MSEDVDGLRRDPSRMEGLDLLEIAAHYETIIRGLEEPPIIMGHSFGGLITQILLDRGLGLAGVAIDSAAPKGVYQLPFSQLRSAFPVLSNPFNYRRTVMLTFDQFRYAFANTMTESEAHEAYDRDAVPGPGMPLFQGAGGNFMPNAATTVNFRNDWRAPLLLIAGEEDHLVPAALNRSNFGKYEHSIAITAYKEFPGRSHLIIAQRGWEEVADYAISWAETQIANLRTQAAA